MTTHTTYTKKHLKPGTEYDFVVTAVNGFGARSARPVHAADVIAPGRPRLTHAATRGHVLLAAWKPPRNNGGAKIRRYHVEYAAGCAPGSKGCATKSDDVPGTHTADLISGIKPGERYQVRVIAHNGRAASPPSKVRTAVKER